MLNLASYIHSPDHSTKGTRSLIDELSVLVSTRFQVLFHSPPGVLFTFPSQYCSTIGHWVVFRLGGWSPHLPTGFHVSGGTLDPASRFVLRVQVSHLLWMIFPHHSAHTLHTLRCPKPQEYCYSWFGLFRFRSPLLSESRLISLPRPT